MRHQAVPHNGLKRLCVRRDAAFCNGWDDDNAIAGFLGVTAVAADYAKNAQTTFLGHADCGNDVGAHILFHIAAANRENQNCILGVGPADLQPFRKYRRPALVIGARGQLRNVVDRAVGFDAAQLAKIINRVAAISSAPLAAME